MKERWDPTFLCGRYQQYSEATTGLMKLPPVTPASHRSVPSKLLHFQSTPARASKKVAEDGPGIWVPASRWETQMEFLATHFSLAQLHSSWPFWELIKQLKKKICVSTLSLPLFLCLYCSAFQINLKIFTTTKKRQLEFAVRTSCDSDTGGWESKRKRGRLHSTCFSSHTVPWTANID